MQNIISLEVCTTLDENGFSLDELVMTACLLFSEKGIAGLLELRLHIVDESLSMNIRHNNSTWQPKSCCDNPEYVFLDRPARQFRTSGGTINIYWRRLRCKHCGKTTIPLKEFMGIDNYQSKTSELEKTVVEVVSEQSYRRGSSHIDKIGHIPVPKSTAHRWVVQSDCDHLDSSPKTLDQLFADGTGYKKRCNKKLGTSNRGELRIALGVDKKGSVVPLGSWSGESWDDIAGEIKSNGPRNKPVADVLVCDGEPGLSAALAELCNENQRCGWHFIHDLNYMLWKEGATKAERDQKQNDLINIIGIELPEEDFKKVSAQEKQDITERLKKARSEINSLYNYLMGQGYEEAAGYVKRGGKNIFTYLERWLRTGLITPRAASMIERMMREIARRLKRIAFGWSPEGAAKMARIVIKRFTSSGKWEKYWKKKLKIDGKVIMTILDVKQISPQTLGR